ncbi:hypothetical protein B0H13DRAFT_1879357 [Mycena leptocephala]|nr:hypothetical protein B0H13DRAFT_1879357 [Mycena leptocephala]
MFLRTNITDSPEVTGRRLCHAVYDGWTKSPKMMSIIDLATQGGSKLSRNQRILDFAMTLEARYLPHPEDPVYVLMAQPCTKDAKLWDDIRAAARTLTYTDNLEVFTPMRTPRQATTSAPTASSTATPNTTACSPTWGGLYAIETRTLLIECLRGSCAATAGLHYTQERNPIGRTKWLMVVARPSASPASHFKQLQETTGTMFHPQDLATANWGTGGGRSSATGTRPIDESALSRGEMADARPTSGRVDATPGAVRLQGGTSTSVIAHPTQGLNQRHQHRLSQNGEPAINTGQQYQAEGGLRAPGENQIPNGTVQTPIPPIERDADPPPPPPMNEDRIGHPHH